MTAKDRSGNTLFQSAKSWSEIGLDADGEMRYGAWQIKETIDLTLQPLHTWKGRYLMHFDTDTDEARIEVRLRYFLRAAKGEVVDTFTKRLEFKID